jgi:hypothetical protein
VLHCVFLDNPLGNGLPETVADRLEFSRRTAWASLRQAKSSWICG